MKETSSIEDIVLLHSGRGMNILQEYLEPFYCRRAARRILALRPGKILLTTGFYVAGRAETDGPPGALIAARALKLLGYQPVIVTDELCRELFEPEGIDVLYVPVSAGEEDYRKILKDTDPVCLISIERCGRNLNNDYANMRGVSIAQETARIDLMFELAKKDGILTIGVGDGGNEIGMGNLKEVISEKLSLVPCVVPADELIIATTSNWGAYALAAWLGVLKGTKLLPPYEFLADYLKRIVAKGCVDGVTKKPVCTVDGFAPEIEEEIFTRLHQAIDGMESPEALENNQGRLI